MKMLGRVLAIVLAFTVMMAITYSAVSASGSSNNTPAFQRGGESFTPDGGSPREFRDHDRGGGVGMIFGLLKNTVIVAIIVAMVVFSKNFLQQQRRAVPVRIK